MRELLVPGDSGMGWASQHFRWILGDRRAHYLAVLTHFDVFMCLWSYLMTIGVGSVVPNLAGIRPEGAQS